MPYGFKKPMERIVCAPRSPLYIGTPDERKRHSFSARDPFTAPLYHEHERELADAWAIKHGRAA